MLDDLSGLSSRGDTSQPAMTDGDVTVSKDMTDTSIGNRITSPEVEGYLIDSREVPDAFATRSIIRRSDDGGAPNRPVSRSPPRDASLARAAAAQPASPANSPPRNSVQQRMDQAAAEGSPQKLHPGLLVRSNEFTPRVADQGDDRWGANVTSSEAWQPSSDGGRTSVESDAIPRSARRPPTYVSPSVRGSEGFGVRGADVPMDVSTTGLQTDTSYVAVQSDRPADGSGQSTARDSAKSADPPFVAAGVRDSVNQEDAPPGAERIPDSVRNSMPMGIPPTGMFPVYFPYPGREQRRSREDSSEVRVLVDQVDRLMRQNTELKWQLEHSKKAEQLSLSEISKAGTQQRFLEETISKGRLELENLTSLAQRMQMALRAQVQENDGLIQTVNMLNERETAMRARIAELGNYGKRLAEQMEGMGKALQARGMDLEQAQLQWRGATQQIQALSGRCVNLENELGSEKSRAEMILEQDRRIAQTAQGIQAECE